jgi:nickel-dependent lactate racemase
LNTYGLYIGDDTECFYKASDLSLKVNFTMLDQPLKKVIVYLDPEEFQSTWLGNKAIYRTRMALANHGELIILAPGLDKFGEDQGIDKMIRKYGYVGTPQILDQVKKDPELAMNLSAAAHLIHGSSEERFSITYCPGKISQEEIESVNFKYHDLHDMQKKYNPEKMQEGLNTMPDGEKIFFISNPAIGLWAHKKNSFTSPT